MKRAIFLAGIVFLAGASLQDSEGCSLRSLEEVEAFAFANNRELKALEEVVSQGRYRKHEAVGALLPALTVEGSAFRTAIGGSFGYGDFYRSTLFFRQKVFSPVDIYNIELKNLDLKVLGKEFDLFCNDLLYRVRAAFIQVLQSEGERALRLDSSSLLKAAYREDEARFEVGRLSSFDLNQSRVAYINSLSLLFEAEKRMKVAKNSLLDLIGMEEGCRECLDLDPSSLSVEAVPFLDQKVSRERSDLLDLENEGEALSFFEEEEISLWECWTMECRPEIGKAQREVEAAEKGVEAQRAEYLPTVGSYANYYNNSPGGVGFSRPKSYWDFGVNFSWPLFDGLARESRIKGARALQSEKRFLYQQTVISGKMALRNQFHELDDTLLRYFSSLEGSKLAKQAVDEGNERRSEGVISPLQYREAVNSLTEANYQLLIAKFELITAYYGLLKESGVNESRVPSTTDPKPEKGS